MSIQGPLSAQTPAERRRSSLKPGGASRASFQAQLEQTASGVSANRNVSTCKGENAADTGASPLSAQSAAALDRSGLMKNDLLSAVADFQSSALERMKKAKENTEEQEAWEKLMKYLDAWIESLREEADIEKIARAHAALAALQSDAETGRQDDGDYLLARLSAILAN